MTPTYLMEGEILLLWNREAPGLRRYFRWKLNGDADAAEDLTAETFTQLHLAYSRGSVENGEALLRTIAEKRLVDEIRHRQRVIPAGLLEHDDERVSDDLELPLGRPLTFETAEFRSDFDSALRSLPDEERDAFILTELRGLNNVEAAAVLGVSHPTVGKRREIATESLRRVLAR